MNSKQGWWKIVNHESWCTTRRGNVMIFLFCRHRVTHELHPYIEQSKPYLVAFATIILVCFVAPLIANTVLQETHGSSLSPTASVVIAPKLQAFMMFTTMYKNYKRLKRQILGKWSATLVTSTRFWSFWVSQSKSKLGQLFRRINRSRARAGYHPVCQSNIKLVGGFKHDFYCPFHIWDVTLPIDEVIFFKMVIAPPIRNGFCVYPRGNPLIVTESRWFNVLDVCRIPVAQAGMGRMLLMCFFISPVAGWRSKKNKMFPVGCFGGLACLGIQD